MKIAIIGYGHVGSVLNTIFDCDYFYDPNIGKSNTKSECNKADVAFICVPTPSEKSGHCDISIVEESIKWLKTELIIIKSTVSVGTTNYLAKKYNKNIVFSPEYYGESKYYIPDEMNDMFDWPYHVFGGKKHLTSKCVDLFMKRLGPTKKYFQTDARTAEMVKYMENCFFATKVTYCQEMYDICKAMDIDYNEAREMFVADPRINEMHTAVFPNNRGFGGKCFPKDLSAMIKWAELADYKPRLLKAVKKTNERIKKHTA